MFQYLPPVTLKDALQETWSSRLDLMYQVSCRCNPRDPNFDVTRIPNVLPFKVAWTLHHCGQAPPLGLAAVIQECDSCEQWYIIRSNPDNNFLCAGCS